MSQVIEKTEEERDEEERELHPVAGSLAAVLWGLGVEGLDGGSFSIGAWAWKSLAFGAAYFGVSVLWRFYKAGTQSSEDRSNPLL